MRYRPYSFYETAHDLFDMIEKLITGGDPKKQRELKRLKSVWLTLDNIESALSDAYESVIAHPRLLVSGYEIDQIKKEIEKDIDRVRLSLGISDETSDYLK